MCNMQRASDLQQRRTMAVANFVSATLRRFYSEREAGNYCKNGGVASAGDKFVCVWHK